MRTISLDKLNEDYFTGQKLLVRIISLDKLSPDNFTGKLGQDNFTGHKVWTISLNKWVKTNTFIEAKTVLKEYYDKRTK